MTTASPSSRIVSKPLFSTRPPSRKSAQGAVAMLVLLAATARAGVVAADLGAEVLHRLRRSRRRCGLSLFSRRLVELGVLILHVLERRLLNLLNLLGGLDLHRHQDARHVSAHDIEQALEQFEGLALELLLGILLRVAAQVDALAQLIQRGQMLAPMRIQALQHDAALEAVPGLLIDLGDLGRVLL